MLVGEMFKRLSYGELSNLSIGSEGTGVIANGSAPKIVQYINEGLLRLYSRYILSEKNLIIQQFANLTLYPLKQKYGFYSGSTEQYKFIQDTALQPFTGDVIKILDVYDELHVKRPLNDNENRHSLYTPKPDVLQVPIPVAGQALGVLYQASHPFIPSINQYLEKEIDIPLYLEEALQAYVAYKVYSDMNGQENAAKAAEHMGRYEQVCGEVDINDLNNNSFTTYNTKLEDRGFV